MDRQTLSQPYQLGEACTVLYLHRGGMLRGAADVVAVKQLPSARGWMISARVRETGIEVDTPVDAFGQSRFLARGTDTSPAGHLVVADRPARRGLFTAAAQIVVTVRGPQQPAVSSHNRQPGDGRPAVLVSVAGVMTVCHGPASVGRRAHAWLDAVQLAEDGHLPTAPRDQRLADPRGFAAGVTAEEDEEPVQVGGHGRDTARDGDADVIVRVGAVSIRCLDRDALVSIGAAWADADRLARIVWGAERVADRPQR